MRILSCFRSGRWILMGWWWNLYLQWYWGAIACKKTTDSLRMEADMEWQPDVKRLQLPLVQIAASLVWSLQQSFKACQYLPSFQRSQKLGLSCLLIWGDVSTLSDLPQQHFSPLSQWFAVEKDAHYLVSTCVEEPLAKRLKPNLGKTSSDPVSAGLLSSAFHQRIVKLTDSVAKKTANWFSIWCQENCL